MARADRFTETGVRPLRYADFSSGFEKNPVTGDLALVVDAEAVKQSVRNLVLTHKGERFFQPQVGCRVHDLLFEPLDSVTTDLMKATVRQAIQSFEPRAVLIDVEAEELPEGDGVQMTITFGLSNQPQPVKLVVDLKRAL